MRETTPAEWVAWAMEAEEHFDALVEGIRSDRRTELLTCVARAERAALDAHVGYSNMMAENRRLKAAGLGLIDVLKHFDALNRPYARASKVL